MTASAISGDKFFLMYVGRGSSSVPRFTSNSSSWTSALRSSSLAGAGWGSSSLNSLYRSSDGPAYVGRIFLPIPQERTTHEKDRFGCRRRSADLAERLVLSESAYPRQHSSMHLNRLLPHGKRTETAVGAAQKERAPKDRDKTDAIGKA